MTVEVFRGNSFKENQALLRAIEEIIFPFYESTTALLGREINHCNTIYINRNENHEINAFAIFAYEHLFVEGEGNIPSFYSGLCASRFTERDKALVFKLWFKAGEDAFRWEEQSGGRLLLWATTATPVTYFAASIFSDVEPFLNGGYQTAHLPYVDAIRRTLKLPERNDSSFPYVLRGVAKDTRYSQSEVQKISRFSANKKFKLLNILGIDERRGDRLLMIGRFKKAFGPSLKRQSMTFRESDPLAQVNPRAPIAAKLL